MLHIYGNLFDPASYVMRDPLDGKLHSLTLNVDALAISINQFTKTNGEAVMGRGCAKEAATRWSEIKRVLGEFNNNSPDNLNYWQPSGGLPIVLFPVKPKSVVCNKDKSNVVSHMQSKFKPGHTVPGWAATASIGLIERFAVKLVELTDTMGWQTVVIPRLGAGAGELPWAQVERLLQQYLDNRFYAITFAPRRQER